MLFGSLILFGFLAGALAVSEMMIKGRKVQSALVCVLAVHLTAGLLCMVFCLALGYGYVLGFGLFWAGEFLLWFGIRSHLESSILLRMLLLLRAEPASEAQLVGKYTDLYGPAARIDELQSAGLIKRSQTELQVTSKGRSVLRIARLLGRG